MNAAIAILVALLMQDIPQDAQGIISKADARVEALRKSFEEACARVRAQELKDLQRIHDSIEKGNPGAAALIKAKIEALSSEVSAAVKGHSSVEQWLQGKWIVTLGGTGDIMEIKGDKVIGSEKGRYVIDGGTVQIIWDSGYVVTMRISKTFGDETTGSGRSGTLVYKRLK